MPAFPSLPFLGSAPNNRLLGIDQSRAQLAKATTGEERLSDILGFSGKYLGRRHFRKIQPHHTRVLLIEAGPRLLPTFPERLSAVAKRVLERLAVEVRLGAAAHRGGGRPVGRRRCRVARSPMA